MVKNLPAVQETWVRSLGREDPWRKAWQPTPVFLPGESPWTEEPGGLQSTGLQSVRHDGATKHSTCWGRFSLCPLSGEFLLINGCWILSTVVCFFFFFPWIYWDDHVFVSVCYLITRSKTESLHQMQRLKTLCMHGIKPTWSWYMILSVYC